MRSKRGTAVPGAIAIILTSLMALSCMALLIVQFGQYSASVKRANVAAYERNKESLQAIIGKVQGDNIVAINVTNLGSTTSLIVGWIKINPSGKPFFMNLDPPVAIQPLQSISIPIDPVPRAWNVSIWTSYGNVFRAGRPPTVEEPPASGPTVPPGEPVYVVFDANGLGDDASGTVLAVDGAGYSRSDLPKAFKWVSGETHSFEWASHVSGASGVRHLWQSTSGLTTAQSGQLTVNCNGHVLATYRTQYYLTVQASPSGGGSVSPESGWHDPGSTVAISATPASGYVFQTWVGSGSDSYSGTSSTASVTMNGPIVETAYFYTFSISASPSNGSVPQGGSISATVTVTLTGGYSSIAVDLSASDLPSGASASFSPNPVTVNPDSSAASTMTISTSSSTPIGTYAITIAGSSGDLTGTATYALTVQMLLVQLREFDQYSSYSPDIRFSTP